MSFFYRCTEGMRVTVHPVYAAEQSDPLRAHYVFVYRVRIENVGPVAARLFWRQWHIHDPTAGDQEVQGAGVVGQTPLLEPGDVYEYRSFCVLRSPQGSMEGFYEFRRPDESVFRAEIPRFLLRVPSE